MSREELVGAYLDGQISRRTLIRRLVGAGVSMGAAVSYAHVLKPERALARADSDHYPNTSVRIVVEDLDRVVNQERLLVRVRADEDSELRDLKIIAYRLKNGIPVEFLGSRTLDFKGPRTDNVRIPLLPAAVASLAARNAVNVEIRFTANDRDGKHPSGNDVARLER